MIDEGSRQAAPEDDHEAAIADFIRAKGITRCPTACLLPTQGSVAAADREALEAHATQRAQLRRAKVLAREQQFWRIEPVGATHR